MRLGAACTLVDVLSEWASHNTQWRLGREIVDVLDGVEVCLTYYSLLVSMILTGGPVGCVRAEIAAEDLPHLIIADGRLATEWAAAVHQVSGRSDDVRAMVAAPGPVVGPLVCTCVGEVVDGGAGCRLRPPFVIFDGWHRGAAWILHGQAGKTYPIDANLIICQRPVPLLGTASGEAH